MVRFFELFLIFSRFWKKIWKKFKIPKKIRYTLFSENAPKLLFYFSLLFPLRDTIFTNFVMATQILFMLVSTTLSSVLPVGRIQKIIGKLSYLISIRILVRSLSVVVNYHDKTNMPKSGICVANHTTVIDVAVLSNNQCFSMVLFSFFFGLWRCWLYFGVVCAFSFLCRPFHLVTCVL